MERSEDWPGNSDPATSHAEAAYRVVSPESLKVFKNAMLNSSDTKSCVQYLSRENAANLTQQENSPETVSRRNTDAIDSAVVTHPAATMAHGYTFCSTKIKK